MNKTIEKPGDGQGLAELVAIARAAHVTNDRQLKATATRKLRDEFGVRITFERPSTKAGASCK